MVRDKKSPWALSCSTLKTNIIWGATGGIDGLGIVGLV